MLICDGEMVIFRYKKLQGLGFIHHLNAYKVQIKNEMACIKQKRLQDFLPLGLHRGFGQFGCHLFVVCRYRVDCIS